MGEPFTLQGVAEWRENVAARPIDTSALEYLEFTGLYDKAGREIYEGDIVRFRWNPFFNEPSEIFKFEMPVEYDNVWGCFVMRLKSKDGEESKSRGRVAGRSGKRTRRSHR
jgi:hypothetical protein